MGVFTGIHKPTNHLDIPAKEMIEEAILAYDGTVIVVSHDRYFISKVANKIVELKDGELHVYHGNYAYYQQKKEEARQKSLAEKLAAEHAAKLAEKRARQKEKDLAKKRKEKD